jgi:hypothetical protein
LAISNSSRPRDLEHVEVGIELDADGAQRGDRLVEEDEARRQAQVHRVDEPERLADHLDRIDVGEARAVVAVEEVAQLRRELLLALLRITDAELGEPARQRVDVLGCRVDEQARQPRHVLVGQLADETEVDEPDPCAVEHEHVRRMRVAVEEPVPEDHLHPRLGDPVGELATLVQ